MISLLSKTAQKILAVLLQDPFREFKEIELIGRAGTGKGAAAALIDALVKEGLLLERRVGKSKIISLHLKNPTAFWLKNIFDYEKLQRLSPERLAAALYFTRESSATLVIVFGSTIAGTATAQSDIDLLIVSQDPKTIETARKKAEELLGQRLNLHLYSREEIRDKIRDDAFVRNVLIRGAVLQGYDLASELYSLLSPKEKKSLEKLFYFKERISAAERNYHQNDSASAQEILERLQEQLIFYILTERKVSYQSKKDAAEAIQRLPKGKAFKSMTKKPLKDKMEIIAAFVQKLLINTILEEEGYGSTIRD